MSCWRRLTVQDFKSVCLTPTLGEPLCDHDTRGPKSADILSDSLRLKESLQDPKTNSHTSKPLENQFYCFSSGIFTSQDKMTNEKMFCSR